MTIKLSESSFEAKLYRFARRTWNNFWLQPEWYNTERTDLCQFIRTIVVLMPLALISNALFIAGVIWLIWVPVQVLGIWTLLKVLIFLGAFATIILAGAGALWGIAVTAEYFKSKSRVKTKTALSYQPKPRSPSISSLIWKWVKARKQGICPQMQIGD